MSHKRGHGQRVLIGWAREWAAGLPPPPHTHTRTHATYPPTAPEEGEAWIRSSRDTSRAGPRMPGLNTPTVNEEKPRSSVMPRSLLCGCLSSAAVDRVVDSAATAWISPHVQVHAGKQSELGAQKLHVLS